MDSLPGSTRGPIEQVLADLDQCVEAGANAVHAYGGEVLKLIGDAVLAVFPTQDDPREAALGAVAAGQQAPDALRGGRLPGTRLAVPLELSLSA